MRTYRLRRPHCGPARIHWPEHDRIHDAGTENRKKKMATDEIDSSGVGKVSPIPPYEQWCKEEAERRAAQALKNNRGRSI